METKVCAGILLGEARDDWGLVAKKIIALDVARVKINIYIYMYTRIYMYVYGI